MAEERELVKIASNNPEHKKGYYVQFKDQMKEGDVIFKGKDKEPASDETATKAPTKGKVAK